MYEHSCSIILCSHPQNPSGWYCINRKKRFEIIITTTFIVLCVQSVSRIVSWLSLQQTYKVSEYFYPHVADWGWGGWVKVACQWPPMNKPLGHCRGKSQTKEFLIHSCLLKHILLDSDTHCSLLFLKHDSTRWKSVCLSLKGPFAPNASNFLFCLLE